MRWPLGALPLMLLIQTLTGCSWLDNDPVAMKLAGTTDQVTPCVANSLGKEFQDTVPVVELGNTPGAREITVNAPRGGILGFVTLEPIPSGGTTVTYYDGHLYWPSRATSGVFPDVARDNWHRAERAIANCSRPIA